MILSANTNLFLYAANPDSPHHEAARLALTLRHHGVTDFATANTKHFEGFGFDRVWSPITD